MEPEPGTAPKSYEIGGKRFYQKPLALRQLSSLVEAIAGMQLPSLNAYGLLAGFGDRLPKILTILLIPESMTIRAHVARLEEGSPTALEETIALMQYECTPLQALEVLQDFLEFNQIGLLCGRATDLIDTMQQSLTERNPIPASSLNDSAP